MCSRSICRRLFGNRKTVARSIVSKSGHGRKGCTLGRWPRGDVHSLALPGDGRRWVEEGRTSIWLNRNGCKGDIFKPGKVWCLAVTQGRVGRASHKFTLSYHLIATVARPRLSREPRGRQKFGPREIALELSITTEQKYTYVGARARHRVRKIKYRATTREDCGSVKIIYTLRSYYSMRILMRKYIYTLRSLFSCAYINKNMHSMKSQI